MVTQVSEYEKRIEQLNGAAFQELANRFLAAKYPNKVAMMTGGSQVGKQKTKKGTPDASLFLPDGTRHFIEHTTNVSDPNKLKNDIESCFSEKKTKVSKSKVKRIILCCNFIVDEIEFEVLEAHAKSFNPRVVVELHALESIALDIQNHHPLIAKDLLGIQLSKGQILTLDEFIYESSKSRGFSTPLDNKFIGRESDQEKLSESIEKNEVIIITGNQGVGKTKLVLEAIQTFVNANPSYSAVAIKDKGDSYTEDLQSHIPLDKDNVLFVDDANRIETIRQILGFTERRRTGKLKTVLTMREYAYADFRRQYHAYIDHSISIDRLSDDDICKLIESGPHPIKRTKIQDGIIRIAKGNARLALMAAQLIYEENSITAIQDVTEVFEKYCDSILIDKDELNSEETIKTMGLLGFFNSVPYKDRTRMGKVLAAFNMDYDQFQAELRKLKDAELVELNSSRAIISEQNIGLYYFYRAFVTDRVLSFETLLEGFYKSHLRRFRDSISPAVNLFNWKTIKKALTPALKKHLAQLPEEEQFSFLDMFWYFLQAESIDFLLVSLDETKIVEQPEKLNTSWERDHHYETSSWLKLFENVVQFSDTFNDVLDLGLKFCSKRPDLLPEFIRCMKQKFGYDTEDWRSEYVRQSALLEALEKHSQSGNQYAYLTILELGKTFLRLIQEDTSSKGVNAIVMNYVDLPEVDSIRSQRNLIFNAVRQSFSSDSDLGLDVLEAYIGYYTHCDSDCENSKNVSKADYLIVLGILNDCADNTNIRHCVVGLRTLRWFSKRGFHSKKADEIAKRLRTPQHERYEAFLDWKLNGKSREDMDRQTIQELKYKEIVSKLRCTNEIDVDRFIQEFVAFKQVHPNPWDFARIFELILTDTFGQDQSLGIYMLNRMKELSKEIGIAPYRTFDQVLTNRQIANEVLAVINQSVYPLQEQWLVSFYDSLRESDIDQLDISQIKELYSKSSTSLHFPASGLLKYEALETGFIKSILSILTMKYEIEGTKWSTDYNFFTEQFDLLKGEAELLGKAYLQQDKIKDSLDYKKEGLKKIFEINPKFIEDYLVHTSELSRRHIHRESENIGFVWEIDGIEDVLVKVFDQLSEKNAHYLLDKHIANLIIPKTNRSFDERVSSFLKEYFSSNIDDDNKVEMIVDVVRSNQFLKFDEFLALFISERPDVESFSNIRWKGHSRVHVNSSLNFGQRDAVFWANMRDAVNRTNLGVKALKIRSYCQRRFEESEENGERERLNEFVSDW